MDRPKVGVGVAVLKDGKVLMCRRTNSHGEGSWCFPGGHLEAGESFEECAEREAYEEAGIKIKNIRFSLVTNDIFKEEEKHYVTIYLIADWDSGNPSVKEPNKCPEWKWFSWVNLPSPLFLCLRNAIKQGFNPFAGR